jgi:hypothetical protein
MRWRSSTSARQGSTTSPCERHVQQPPTKPNEWAGPVRIRRLLFLTRRNELEQTPTGTVESEPERRQHLCGGPVLTAQEPQKDVLSTDMAPLELCCLLLSEGHGVTCFGAEPVEHTPKHFAVPPLAAPQLGTAIERECGVGQLLLRSKQQSARRAPRLSLPIPKR